MTVLLDSSARDQSVNVGAAFLHFCSINDGTSVFDIQGRHSVSELIEFTREVAAEAICFGEKYHANINRKLVLLLIRNTASDLAYFYGLSYAGFIPCVADPSWSADTVAAICSAYGIGVVAGSQLPFEPGIRAGRGADYNSSGPAIAMQLLPSDRLTWTQAALPRVGFVRFSSGSTGRPKAIAFEGSAALRASETWAEAAQLSKADRIFCVASVNNGLAFNTSLLSSFRRGCDLVMHSGKLNPNLVWRKIRDHRPTVIVGFPFLWELLLESRESRSHDFDCVRYIWSSAAPLDQNLSRRWVERFGLPINHYYGVAETGPITFNDASENEGVGSALPDCQIKTVPESGDGLSRIHVRSPYMALGYLSENSESIQPLPTTDGYYITSDIGYLNATGRLSLKRRSDRVANVRGRKFDLLHTEEIIADSLGIRAAVFTQFESGPLVLYLETAVPVTLDEIYKRCGSRIESWQLPDYVISCNYLPRSASGKVLLSELPQPDYLKEHNNETR